MDTFENDFRILVQCISLLMGNFSAYVFFPEVNTRGIFYVLHNTLSFSNGFCACKNGGCFMKYTLFPGIFFAHCQEWKCQLCAKKRPIVFCNYKNGSTREFPLEFWCFSWFIYKFSSQCYTAHACSLLRTFFNKITKVNWGLEGTSDIMVTTKLGVESILQYSERVNPHFVQGGRG